MAYGLKISKLGHDAKSASNRNLIITSDLECLKMKQSGGGTYAYSSFAGAGSPGIVSQTYNHNLGYIPFVFAFVETSRAAQEPTDAVKGRKIIPLYEHYHHGAGVGETEVARMKITTTQLTLEFSAFAYNGGYTGGNYNVIFKYFIFANKIT